MKLNYRKLVSVEPASTQDVTGANMSIVIYIFCLVAMTMAGQLEDSNDQFTSRMFTEVVRMNPGSSVVMSAFSVLPPLALLALASVGESHDELLRAISLPNDNVTKEVFTHLASELRSLKGVELKMANKVYILEGAELNQQFAAVSRDVFNCEVQNIDFTQNTAAETINTWVEDHTNHRIKNLLNPDDLDDTTNVVLVNAIYFKGIWKDIFNKALTVDRDFHVTETTTIKVPTMHKEGEFRYGESVSLNAKLLEIPYEGDESSFIIVLPNDGINELVERLKDRTALQEAMKNMVSMEVDVYLPKFKIETTTNLREVLNELNIHNLFDPVKARLNNLLKGVSDLHMTNAVQKAFIEVNEEGAEAAAANAFYQTRFGREMDLQFIVDRPFYYLLKSKDLVLFSGVFTS